MRHRKLMNQINVVPFIDVMLVLLIVFMIATPSMRTGEIELPSVGQALTPTQGDPIEVVIRANGNISVREGGDGRLNRDAAVRRIQELQRVRDRPVVIAADRAVRYEEVVNLLGALHAAGVKRVGLAAREGS
ncbi:MAG: ExbD/TolR family protein [Burkholderiales bacterium]|nr:MAG: ExbD/TolR family protein [Burkholderiales bacterium]TAG77643.1 MAG: ExbD/TolR family protein [Betaproteobacteria bacterium]